jgi:hypothetical protein
MNIMVIDNKRYDVIKDKISTSTIMYMDYVAIDNKDGTVNVIKNRRSANLGTVSHDEHVQNIVYYSNVSKNDWNPVYGTGVMGVS